VLGERKVFKVGTPLKESIVGKGQPIKRIRTEKKKSTHKSMCKMEVPGRKKEIEDDSSAKGFKG